MILSKNNLKTINIPGLEMPDSNIFELPEKVLQFGTGVLLRGLPDYFIDKANRQGVFNGRVAVVKSTDTGSITEFDVQNNLYTIYSKGVEHGKEVSEQVICSAISRVLIASKDWSAILDIAKSKDLQIIISNTTEVGIQLVEEDIHQQPPASYPGKLLAVLHERYKAFNGNESIGLVIIPTELIVENANKLKSIVLELANFNQLDTEFIHWLEHNNSFCNSLVDRIVPGKPDKASAAVLEKQRGYKDDLHIMSETYSFWAIEGDDKIAAKLSFSVADKGVVITPDIGLFRELKLRLLNGSHTLSCAVALLSGFNTVKESMDDEGFVSFITQLSLYEIIPAIPYKVDHQVAFDFANSVLDRFRNPYIRHEWLSISAQYSAKIKMRVIPLILNYYKINNTVPDCMALGFASYLRFMKVAQNDKGSYKGLINGKDYLITDSQASYFCDEWKSPDTLVENVLKNKALWDTNLIELPGFAAAVQGKLNKITADDVRLTTV
jgi:tagaturonate reductase